MSAGRPVEPGTVIAEVEETDRTYERTIRLLVNRKPLPKRTGAASSALCSLPGRLGLGQGSLKRLNRRVLKTPCNLPESQGFALI